MKSWASDASRGASRRDTVLRATSPSSSWARSGVPARRRPGEEGGHHGGARRALLDGFEKAGVSEFTEGQRGPALRLARSTGGAGAADTRRQARHAELLGHLVRALHRRDADARGPLAGLRRARAVVIGVSVDRGAPRAVLEPYIRNLALTFPILLDPDSKTATAWRVTGSPATFVVQPGGEVAGMAAGAREWNGPEMRALIETLLPHRIRVP